MILPIDDLKEDAYIITNDTDQYFVPATIYEGLNKIGTRNGWDFTHKTKSRNGLYYGTTSKGHYIALGTRFYFDKETMDKWNEAFLNQKDTIEFVPVDQVNLTSDFSSMTSKGYSFEIDPETMIIVKSTIIDFLGLSQLFADFCDMAAKMSSDINNPIHPKDIVVFDDAKYRDGFIDFSKGKRRKVKPHSQLSISSRQFEMFNEIISNGDCKVDQIRFLIRLDEPTRKSNSNDSQLGKTNYNDSDIGFEKILYPGGSAFIFPIP